MTTKLVNYQPLTKNIVAIVNTKRVTTNVTTKPSQSILSVAENAELLAELVYLEKAIGAGVKYLNPGVTRPTL